MMRENFLACPSPDSQIQVVGRGSHQGELVVGVNLKAEENIFKNLRRRGSALD